jgi:hypothetical protein
MRRYLIALLLLALPCFAQDTNWFPVNYNPLTRELSCDPSNPYFAVQPIVTNAPLIRADYLYGSGVGVTNTPLYTGFPTKDTSSLVFSNATRSLHFSALTGCRYTVNNQQWVSATNWVATIDDTEGGWYIYRSPSDVLTVTQNAWPIDGEAQVAYVYWDAEANSAVWVIDERHSCWISDVDHYKEHSIEGNEWLRGGTIIWNSVVGVPSTSGSNSVFSITPVETMDEDITNWTTAADQTIGNQSFVAYTNDAAVVPILYATGTVANVIWRSQTNGYFSFLDANNIPVYTRKSGGQFQTNAVPEDNYFIQMVCKIPSVTGLPGIVSIPYTNTFTTLTGAQSVAVDTYFIDRTSYLSPEIKPLYLCYYLFNATVPSAYPVEVKYTKLAAVTDLRYGNNNPLRNTGVGGSVDLSLYSTIAYVDGSVAGLAPLAGTNVFSAPSNTFHGTVHIGTGVFQTVSITNATISTNNVLTQTVTNQYVGTNWYSDLLFSGHPGSIRIGTGAGRQLDVVASNNLNSICIGSNAMGQATGNFNSIAIGIGALQGANAAYNTTIGHFAGPTVASTVASPSHRTTAIGYGANNYGNYGSDVTCLGFYAGYYNWFHGGATFLGAYAGSATDFGLRYNGSATAVGYYTMEKGLGNLFSVALGRQAMQLSTNNHYSICLGMLSGAGCMSATNCIGLGVSALRNVSNSWYSIAIGDYANVTSFSTNRYAFGKGVTNSYADNSIVFGSSNVWWLISSSTNTVVSSLTATNNVAGLTASFTNANISTGNFQRVNLNGTNITDLMGSSFLGFRANCTSSLSYAETTWTRINFSNELFDVGGNNYNTESNAFLVPRTGYYEFNVCVSPDASYPILDLGIFTNGVMCVAGAGIYHYSSAYRNYLGFQLHSGPLYLQQGVWVSAYLYSEYNYSSMTIKTNDWSNWFSGKEVH